MKRPLPMLFATFVLTWVALAITLDTWGRTRAAEGGWDAIIVAGCRVEPDGAPSRALAARVRLAVELWESGAAPLIVFTGGVGTYPPSEAEASAKLAARLGVPTEAMVLEERSTSTTENAMFAARVLHPGVGSAEARPTGRVLVVTDAYHVFRARRVFARYFAEVGGVGSTYGQWSRVRGSLREVLAVLGYWARGAL